MNVFEEIVPLMCFIRRNFAIFFYAVNCCRKLIVYFLLMKSTVNHLRNGKPIFMPNELKCMCRPGTLQTMSG